MYLDESVDALRAPQVPAGAYLQSGVYQLLSTGTLGPDHGDHPFNRGTLASGNGTAPRPPSRGNGGGRRTPGVNAMLATAAAGNGASTAAGGGSGGGRRSPGGSMMLATATESTASAASMDDADSDRNCNAALWDKVYTTSGARAPHAEPCTLFEFDFGCGFATLGVVLLCGDGADRCLEPCGRCTMSRGAMRWAYRPQRERPASPLCGYDGEYDGVGRFFIAGVKQLGCQVSSRVARPAAERLLRILLQLTCNLE